MNKVRTRSSAQESLTRFRPGVSRMENGARDSMPGQATPAPGRHSFIHF